MPQNKTVLIIGYYWPYTFGGHRIYGLVRHFHEFGWHPIILTRPLSKRPPSQDCTVIEVPFKGDIFRYLRPIIRALLRVKSEQGLKAQVKSKLGASKEGGALDRLFNLFQEFFGYPDTEKSWLAPAIREAEKLLDGNKVDIILSEWPVISHVVASNIKCRYRVPWIADFTDLWSQNHNYLFGRFRQHLDARLEKKTLRNADLLITVSEPWANKLRTLHNKCRIEAIEHGYDPASSNVPAVALANNFIISYTGRVYSEMQDPEPFFAALSELIAEREIRRDTIEVRFYGDRDPWILNQVTRFGLRDVVKLFDRLPKEEIVYRQRESQLLLLLALCHENQKGCYTSKLYDYLAARRPILCVGGARDDVIPVLLDESKAGVHARSKDEVKNALLMFYRQYCQMGYVVYEGVDALVSGFDYRTMTRRFVEKMDGLTNHVKV